MARTTDLDTIAPDDLNIVPEKEIKTTPVKPKSKPVIKAKKASISSTQYFCPTSS